VVQHVPKEARVRESRVMRDMSRLTNGVGASKVPARGDIFFRTPVWCVLFFSYVARVADPDPDWILIQLGQWIRIRIRVRIQEGKNDPQK
jgi:hypothetical protein